MEIRDELVAKKSKSMYSRKSNEVVGKKVVRTIRDAASLAYHEAFQVNGQDFFRSTFTDVTHTGMLFIAPDEFEKEFHKADALAVDGTFQTVPNLFQQMLTIKVVKEDKKVLVSKKIV